MPRLSHFDVGVRSSVRIQSIGNEELVAALHATAAGDASLLRIISGGFFFVSTSPVNGRVYLLRKFVIIN